MLRMKFITFTNISDASHWTTRSCEIQTLYVSFKDLEWQVSNRYFLKDY